MGYLNVRLNDVGAQILIRPVPISKRSSAPAHTSSLFLPPLLLPPFPPPYQHARALGFDNTMPYAVPAIRAASSASSTTTTTALAGPTSPMSPRPAGHRRTRSTGNFSDERGPGAFVSLGSLPRSHKRAVFHIDISSNDDDDDDTPSAHTSETSGLPSYTSPLPPTNSLRLSMTTGKFSPTVEPPSRIEMPYAARADSLAPGSVPFPTSSPLSPTDPTSPFIPTPSLAHSRASSAYSLPRTPSTPIILSNGKPLKPSLKSSLSSPNIADLPRAASKHLRAQSAPSTPAGPKNVHFAEKDAGLESVRVFSRSGKPASLSKPPGEETETETEAEGSSIGQNSFPFPSVSSDSPLHEIDPSPSRTSAIPARDPSPYANVHLETLSLPRTRSLALRGTVLVRNIHFEKRVAVRFTLDDWQTTSEVTCKHVVSLPSLPPPFPQEHRTLGDLVASIAGGQARSDEKIPSWDRFRCVPY